ncbi:MAG: hypothetical protein QGG40_14775 [Myxococcota bacterium]|nr:hypothetical protein [Myxococcota bacterium]
MPEPLAALVLAILVIMVGLVTFVYLFRPVERTKRTSSEVELVPADGTSTLAFRDLAEQTLYAHASRFHGRQSELFDSQASDGRAWIGTGPFSEAHDSTDPGSGT